MRLLRGLPYVAFVIAVWPLLADGFPRGHDWAFELVRIAEYRSALEAGQLPPFWAENLYSGYGSPIFLFYAPLFLLASSVLSWLSSFPAAATWVLIGLTLVSVWTTQRMMRAAAVDAAGARVAVYFYVLSPYLLGDKLIRNANAEFAGLCLAPVALTGLFLLSDRKRAALLWLSIGLALTILSHNLTALVVMGLLLLGGPILYFPRLGRDGWLALAAGIALGLALAAFFWLPALLLGDWMRPEELLTGKFDFHVQFTTLLQLFAYDAIHSLATYRTVLFEPRVQSRVFECVLQGSSQDVLEKTTHFFRIVEVTMYGQQRVLKAVAKCIDPLRGIT